MIKIIAKLQVKPECKEELIKLVTPLIEASRAEAGNIDYGLHESLEDPNSLAFIEIWKDQAAIDSHNASEHFTSTLPKVAPLCEGPMTADFYKVLV